jgi:hypothetical protein
MSLQARSRLSVGASLVALSLALTSHACGGGGTAAPGDGGSNGSGSGTSSGPNQHSTAGSSASMTGTSTGGSTGTTSTATSGSSSSAGDAGGFTYDGSCSPDALKTGLVAMQTGVSVDAFDCEVLKWAHYYGEPDPMIFKAIIYVESRFVDTSVACSNDPCGIPKGWTAAESGCFGLMQVVPACHDDPDDAGLLADGHPNLTRSTSSSLWTTSIFNPDVNIEIGVSGVAGNRGAVEKEFPGCTTEQYTLMAVGNYNSYGSTKSCTVYNTAYDEPMLTAYRQYAAAARYPAMSY